MIKIFFSSPYNIRHENVTVLNVEEMLKDDVRAKIIGNVKDFVYGSDGVLIGNNTLYLGGFYYEQDKYNGFNECENTVRCELDQIDRSDIVFVSLLKYSAIASITELLYASFKNKKIVVFCDKNITQFKVEYEYWFPLITSMYLDKKIDIVYVSCEDEIIDYIRKLDDENED